MKIRMTDGTSHEVRSARGDDEKMTIKVDKRGVLWVMEDAGGKDGEDGYWNVRFIGASGKWSHYVGE